MLCNCISKQFRNKQVHIFSNYFSYHLVNQNMLSSIIAALELFMLTAFQFFEPLNAKNCTRHDWKTYFHVYKQGQI